MEIPHRNLLDASFAKRMAKLSNKQRKRLRKLMGTPPDPSRVPEQFWLDVQKETEEELTALLFLVFMASADFHAEGDSGLEDSATLFSLARSKEVADGYAETAKKRFDTLAGELRDAEAAEKALTKQDYEDGLAKTFGPGRADSISTSETTAAQSAGGEAAMEQGPGLDPADLWINQPHLSATGPCPICLPLHRTPRSAWGVTIPGGPPAHPNCVCIIQYARTLADG